jgi:bifunctional non-homologous end joining protein LigD
MDKKPTADRRERAKSIATPRQSSAAASGAPRFTNTDKVLFPEAGITKGDVLAYYVAIAPKLLPHLRDRPMTLERLPDGLRGPKASHFWQKNTPEHYPDWIPRVKLPTERGQPVHYALVNDVRTLLFLVNQGTLTFHPFLSRTKDFDRPDYVLFDIDPHQSTFANAVKAARHLHDLLEAAEVKSFVKPAARLVYTCSSHGRSAATTRRRASGRWITPSASNRTSPPSRRSSATSRRAAGACTST